MGDYMGIFIYRYKSKGVKRYHKYGNCGDKALFTLTYNNIPLIKFHADKYFYPTWEKLVSAGYGLDMTNDGNIREMRQLFNSPFVSLENSFGGLIILQHIIKHLALYMVGMAYGAR